MSSRFQYTAWSRRDFKSAAAACVLAIAGCAMLTGNASAQQAGTLTVAQSYDPVSLWPNVSTSQEQINVGNAIVESLYWIDPKTGKGEPVLATGYKIVDPKTVRIQLRKGVTFSNGEPFNADAAVHTFKVFTDVKITPAYGRYAEPIERVTKEDDYTIIMHLKHPYPAIELLLGQVYMLPPAYWKSVGGADGFGRKPIGTGPFMLTEWIRDSRIVMDANPKYWGAPLKGIKRVVWRPIPDDMARASGLLAGEYDIAANIPISASALIKSGKDVSLVATPSFRIFTVNLSNLPEHPGPLQDKRVRQAMNYAIDKKGLVDGLLQGQGRLLSGQVLRKEQPGFDPSVKDYPHDPKKARALLAEAGFPNGLDIVFKFPVGRYAQDKEVSEAIAGMLAEVGVRAKMVPLEAGEFLRQLSARELQPMGYVGLAPPDDPDPQMAQYRSDWRYSYVSNKALDGFIDAGAREMDPVKRAQIYQQAGRLMNDEASVIFLFQAVDLYGVNKRIKGFTPRGDQRWVLQGVSKD